MVTPPIDPDRCSENVYMKKALMIFASLAVTASSAQAYCSAPTAPYCATRYGAFDDQDDFDRCKREMASYQSEAQDFLSCTKRDADDLKRKSDNVIDEYNSAVESFKRRARG
jgi:hypothetical protein